MARTPDLVITITADTRALVAAFQNAMDLADRHRDHRMAATAVFMPRYVDRMTAWSRPPILHRSRVVTRRKQRRRW